jgi:hypothetical protein
MKAIKNYELFKKSLLVSTNGTMVESFDSSNIFNGCEYQSYRVYVDDVHYYNMFVIHNFASNSYDVSLETSNCAVSTMSRVVKTQKAMIKSVCRWCNYSYLNTKEISVDSEEYTDRCEETEKHYADYTSEDFIKSGIAKDCTTCPDFCEEDCIENAECSRGNDVFDGCKTVKDVMEVKQELNARFGKEQYFDTDSLQPNKTISAKIENINHCPNQDTCCIVSPLVHCNYNYKSDSCIKAHKNFIHDCEQVHKQMKARSNPEWHHVSLATLANIDFDMLDEKRKLVRDINHILKDGIRNLYKCENHISFEVLERYVIRKCDEMIRHNRLKSFWFSYIARQLDEVRRNTIYLYTPYITTHRNKW